MLAKLSIKTLMIIAAAVGGQNVFGQTQADQIGKNALLDLSARVAEGDRFTLSQALKAGLRDNPQVKIAQSMVRSAKENYNSQKSPINPTLSYSALNNTVAPISYADGFALGSNYSMYWTLETNGANRYRTRQAHELFQQAQFDSASTQLSLKLNIINAYVGLQVSNQALEVELKVYDNVKKLSVLTQKRFETGAGPQADATRAKIAEIEEQQNVITFIANVNQARATLNTQLGRPQVLPVDVADPLTYRPITTTGLIALLDQAKRDRPELQSARANLRSLQAIPGLEKSAYFPNVVLAKDFGSDGQTFIGLSVPIDLGGIRGSVAKAKSDIKTQEAQIDLQSQSIDLDVRTCFINFEAARKQVASYESGILQMSETLQNQVRQGYELGSNTIVDILTAENTYRSVQSAYHAAVGAFLIAAYNLKHSIGELPDSFQTEPFTNIGKEATTISPQSSISPDLLNSSSQSVENDSNGPQ